MREILFRAKSQIDCQWIYGSLITKEFQQPNWEDLSKLKYINNYEICSKDENDWTSQYKNIPVFEQTIGQYIGLNDKNNTKIFEGDVVRLIDKFAHYLWTAVVEFGNPNGEYVWGWNLKPTPRCCNSKLSEFNKDILCWVEMPVGATCEIIGNIWDNPELLEGE